MTARRTDTWMPLYIGDYLADTSRLNTEQHGAYLLLLMDYWRNGPPLDDDDELASITKLAVPQWRKHAAKLRSFFNSVDGRLVQKRVEAERQKASGVSSKRAEAGREGASKRWGKQDGNGIANAIANASQNDAPSQSQETKRKDLSERDPHARASANVEGFEPTTAGRMCRVMREAGLAAVNPGDPRLLALVAQGATEAEFAGLAAEAVAGGKGFPWVLVALQGRRADAALVALAPPPKPPDWRDTRSGVIQRACALGIGPFEEISPTGRAASFDAYKRRVLEADAAQEQHA